LIVINDANEKSSSNTNYRPITSRKLQQIGVDSKALNMGPFRCRIGKKVFFHWAVSRI